MCIVLPYSGYWILFLLGRVPYKSLDCTNLFGFSKHGSKWFGLTRGCGSNNSSETLSLRQGGTVHLVPPHRGPVRSGGYQISETQIYQCPCQPTSASPSGHSRHTGCLQRVRSTFWFFERCFAWAVRKEQVPILLWIASSPHGNAGPQAQRPHGEIQTTSPSRSISRHRPLFDYVSHSPVAVHERSSRCWQPQGSRGDGEGRGCLVGCSRRPRPYGRSHHDSAKKKIWSPAHTGGKRGNKRSRNGHSKSHPLPAQIYIAFTTLAIPCTNFTMTTPTRLTFVYLTLYLVWKLNCRRTHSVLAAIPAHATATAMHFPANAGLIFLTDEVTNDRYLVDTGATLRTRKFKSIWSPSQRGRWTTYPLLGIYSENFSLPVSCKPLWQVPFWALTSWETSTENSQIHFACTTAASPASSCLPTVASSCLPSFTPVLAQPPAQTTSSQPPAISAQLVWNPEVKSSSFSVRENQYLLDPAPSLQTIPDSVPVDIKLLLQNIPPFYAPGMCCPGLLTALSITFIPVATHPFLQNPTALIHKNLKSPKWHSKGENQQASFVIPNRHGHRLCTWYPKKTDHGGLVAITAILSWLLPLTNTPCQTCKTFQMAWMVAKFFPKSILWKGITKSQLPSKMSSKQPSSPFLVCSNSCSPLLIYISNAAQTFQHSWASLNQNLTALNVNR